MNDATAIDLFRRLDELNEIGIALSREKDINRLLEAILVAAKKITNADGGTLYRMHEDKRAALRDHAHRLARVSPWAAPPASRSRSIRSSSTTRTGSPNNSMVVAYAVLHDQTVNIADAYTEQGFDFSGTKSFDGKTGYRSQVLPHGADEEPRRRNHRRAAADQRQGSRDRRDRAVFARPTSAWPNRSPRRRPSR